MVASRSAACGHHLSCSSSLQINNVYNIPWGNDAILEFTIRNKNLLKIPYISLAIYDKEQRPVAEVLPIKQNLEIIEKNNEITFAIQLKNLEQIILKNFYFIL